MEVDQSSMQISIKEGAKDYTTNRNKTNYNQAKHEHDNRNIFTPRTTTAATTTATTINLSAPQTTKLAPTTPTQTSLNDNGRKPQGRQNPIKRPALLHAPPRKLNQRAKSPYNTTNLKSGQKPTRRIPH
ncbi:hypothetical protein CHS0354_017496 [Potamilus streckersoni]|uniref:Uncharacterized protein n=1 Tax=Potamilus streckersoni TaxID=2493646 RepID=A0AAE0TIB5_9BIVA|nr:hypothetical protein CHS0354_017496 [Potamilus streckersoni]